MLLAPISSGNKLHVLAAPSLVSFISFKFSLSNTDSSPVLVLWKKKNEHKFMIFLFYTIWRLILKNSPVFRSWKFCQIFSHSSNYKNIPFPHACYINSDRVKPEMYFLPAFQMRKRIINFSVLGSISHLQRQRKQKQPEEEMDRTKLY